MEDLSGAACAGMDPNLWDPDMHHHAYVGNGNPCWSCDDAAEVCAECPVFQACYTQARRLKESHTIRAGLLWSNGRPRNLRKRRA